MEYEGLDLIPVVPDYLLESSGSDSSYEVFISSGAEEESGEREAESSTVSYDYSSDLDGIQSSLILISDQQAAIILAQEYYSDQVNELNNNLVLCSTILVLFTVFGFIKVVFTIFNKYLGLGQA